MKKNIFFYISADEISSDQFEDACLSLHGSNNLKTAYYHRTCYVQNYTFVTFQRIKAFSKWEYEQHNCGWGVWKLSGIRYQKNIWLFFRDATWDEHSKACTAFTDGNLAFVYEDDLIDALRDKMTAVYKHFDPV